LIFLKSNVQYTANVAFLRSAIGVEKNS